MIVLKGTYDELKRKYNKLVIAHESLTYEYRYLQLKWNNLVKRINAKGGEEFLNSNPESTQFTKEEIKTLIFLCHPDKHNGNARANDITVKLLKMKG